MNRYTKVIGPTGFYFLKEFEKKKHHKNKIRALREETVAKVFLEDQAEVLVTFEDNEGREIILDSFSSPEEIRKYLGAKFLKK